MRNELLTALDAGGGRLDRIVVARVMGTTGFGGRRTGEVLIVGDGHANGTLASGAADGEVTVAARQLLASNDSAALVSISVGDDEAVRAGLACGGSLDVLLQRAATLGEAIVEQIVLGRDLVLVTHPETGCTLAVTSAGPTIPIPDDFPVGWVEAVNVGTRMLTKGPVGTVMVSENTDALFVQGVAATPSLLVFGKADLAEAILRVGALLGWEVTVAAETEVDAALATLSSAGPQDGLVVLSHDIAASGAVLAAALSGRCGYVGALGSRHTQHARRLQLIEALNVSHERVDMINGPVGLDLGARSPEETAIAIVAEMLATTRKRNAASLASTSGPING